MDKKYVNQSKHVIAFVQLKGQTMRLGYKFSQC